MSAAVAVAEALGGLGRVVLWVGAMTWALADYARGRWTV